MKYLCLIYQDPGKMAQLNEIEINSIVQASLAYDAELRYNGRLLASAALEPATFAVARTVRNGKVAITDGPFAESKEHMGGFWLFEARDFNEAIRLASKLPPARLGTLEIRPVHEYP